MYFNYIYQITILKVEKLFIPFLVSCVTGGKIVLISKVNFVLLRLKQKKQDMITSVKLMLNKSRILNNGSYPLVFQVIHNRRKKLLYTGYRVKEEVFDELEGKIMNGVSSTFTATEVVKMNRELRKMRNRIDTRIRQLERTTLDLQWRIFWLKVLLVQENHSFIYCDISMRRLSVSRN